MSTQPADASSIDQVRELLMGSQLKEIENRLLRQEEQFAREIADLRANLKNRAESLENFMKSESASLLHRMQEEQTGRTAALKSEQKERTEALKTEQRERSETVQKERNERDAALAQLAKDFTKKLEAKEEAFERKLAALSSTLDAAEQELRQLLFSENARLSEKVDEKYTEALSTLTNTAAQIRNDVVSRSSISAMFAEAALRFSGQSPENPAPVTEEQPDASAGS